MKATFRQHCRKVGPDGYRMMFQPIAARTAFWNALPSGLVGQLAEAAIVLNKLRHRSDDEKGVATIDTLGGPQETTIISEPGLYRAIIQRRYRKGSLPRLDSADAPVEPLGHLWVSLRQKFFGSGGSDVRFIPGPRGIEHEITGPARGH